MKLKLVLLVSALAAAGAAKAVSLSVFNFNDSTTGNPNLIVDRTDATGVESSVLDVSAFSNTQLGSNNGSLINAVDGDVAGNDLSVSGATVAKSFTVLITANDGYELSGLNLSFAFRRSGTGPMTNSVTASIDGGTATELGTFNSPNASYAGFSFAVPGTVTDTILLTFNVAGATNVNGTGRFDNIALTGDVQAVPEPASMVALGLGAAAMIRRRRKA